MTKNDISALKHSLMDYNYYKSRIDMCRQRLSEIDILIEEMAYPRMYYGERLYERDPYKTLFDTERYSELNDERGVLEDELKFCVFAVNRVDDLLEGMDEPLRSMLIDIYIKGMPVSAVARKYYYSDEKSIHRYVRKELSKM